MKTRLATVGKKIGGKEAKTVRLDNSCKGFCSVQDQRIRREAGNPARVCLLFKTGDKFVCCWKLSSRTKTEFRHGGWCLGGGKSRSGVLQKVREHALQSPGGRWP